MVMTNDKKLHKMFLDILEEYQELFDKKAQIIS
jgi:hypothetical protein